MITICVGMHGFICGHGSASPMADERAVQKRTYSTRHEKGKP